MLSEAFMNTCQLHIVLLKGGVCLKGTLIKKKKKNCENGLYQLS